MVAKTETSGQLRRLTERDLKALRVFRAAAEAGGLAAAEQQLHMTRSAISRYIRDAERSLGVRLCERGPAGFLMLEAGEIALRGTTEALDALDRIQAEVDANRGLLSGKISIGIADNLVLNEACRAPEALRRVAQKSTAIVWSVTVASPERLLRMLAERRTYGSRPIPQF
jgi:DNA-binding transcriptional LysR family regulator